MKTHCFQHTPPRWTKLEQPSTEQIFWAFLRTVPSILYLFFFRDGVSSLLPASFGVATAPQKMSFVTLGASAANEEGPIGAHRAATAFPASFSSGGDRRRRWTASSIDDDGGGGGENIAAAAEPKNSSWGIILVSGLPRPASISRGVSTARTG